MAVIYERSIYLGRFDIDAWELENVSCEYAGDSPSNSTWLVPGTFDDEGNSTIDIVLH